MIPGCVAHPGVRLPLSYDKVVAWVRRTRDSVVDGSKTPKTITVVGSPTFISSPTAKSSDGGGCIAFAAGKNLNFASSADFAFTGDGTVEGWLYVSTQGATNRMLYDNRTVSDTGFGVYSSASASSTQYDRLLYASNTAVVAGASSTPQIGSLVLTHWAVSKQGTTIRGFLGGTHCWTYTDGRTMASAVPAFFGANGGNAQNLVGNLDNMVVTKGVALYTASFTPVPIL